MKFEHSKRSDTIFQAAVDLGADDRPAYLDLACAGDEELRREVESLLAAYERAGSFMERPAIETDAAVVAGQQPGSLVGRTIQHYRIVRLLGVGGMGEVYLATDTKLRRQVALKLLPASFTNDAGRVSRFRQEARAASALNHPNILTIYEIGEADGHIFISMEYVDGETLRERLHDGHTTLAKRLGYLAQMAEGLAKAHAAGIVHRDLKPDNVMISRDGYAKILDFGLAKLVPPPTMPTAGRDTGETATALMHQQHSLPGMVMGTVGYMSPEQALGKIDEIDHRSDIFSFGCILYEASTGQRAFDGKDTIDTLNKIIREQAIPVSTLNPDIPYDLQRIVRRCLAKDADERYQTIKDVAIEIKELRRELQNDQPHTTVPPSVLSRAGVASPSLTSTTSSPVSSAEYVVSQIRSHRKGFVVALLLAVVVLAGLGFGLYKFFGRGQSARSGAQLKVTPLTSSPYIERNVAFSPDGRQVAYSWTGEKDDNFDIYVKLVGAGDPLRLTTDPARDMSPTWSPDGSYIAFLRGTGDGRGVFIVSALGGAERKLTDVYEWKQQGTRPEVLDWSPDGKTLAVSDKMSEDEPWSIFLISVDTGERRRLTQPPAGYNGDSYLSFSPDGSRLAFTRSHTGTADIYTVPVTSGEPLRITSDEADISGLTWTRDGTDLVFASDRGGTNSTLWRVPAAGGAPTPVAGVGENVHELSIARQGDRLAYAQSSVDVNIYRLELVTLAGSRRASGPPVSFISSTRIEVQPQFSPDGRRIAFWSDRSGGGEIWVCDADGKNLLQLTRMTSVHGHGASWSPDGHFIAFTSLSGGNADIYVVSADGGTPRRLTTDPSAELSPTWSRDGRWIYFGSNRTGRSEVWKMPAVGGEATQLTHGGASNPVESPDGRSVYFIRGALQTRRRSEPGLWQVPASGGEETRLFDLNVDAGNWSVMERGVYFLTPHLLPEPSYALEFFDFATRQLTPITTLAGRDRSFLINGLTISPDEHWALYGQRDKIVFNLMLVENFH